MDNNFALAAIGGVISLLLTVVGVLIGIVYSRISKVQEIHSTKIAEHDIQIKSLEQAQHYEIDNVVREVSQLKKEIHELRQMLTHRITQENDVLRQVQQTLLKFSDNEKKNAIT